MPIPSVCARTWLQWLMIMWLMAWCQTCSVISTSRAACVASAAALSAGSSFPGDVTGTERVTSRVVKRLSRACHKPFLLHISFFFWSPTFSHLVSLSRSLSFSLSFIRSFFFSLFPLSVIFTLRWAFVMAARLVIVALVAPLWFSWAHASTHKQRHWGYLPSCWLWTCFHFCPFTIRHSWAKSYIAMIFFWLLLLTGCLWRDCYGSDIKILNIAPLSPNRAASLTSLLAHQLFDLKRVDI